MKRNSFLANILKYILQWAALIAIVVFIVFFKQDPEKYCPMGGIQAFITYIVRGSLPCSMTSAQIVMGLALAVAVVLFSKLFCGFLCPIGTVEDLLKKLRKAIGLPSIDIKSGSVGDKILRIVKYALLFWIVYMTASSSELFCKNLDPYYAVATGFKGEITLWMSIVALCLVIIPSLLIDRFWCKYICPLGAASNTLKFYIPFAILVAVYVLLGVLGVSVPWWVLFAAILLLGYILEITVRPVGQVLHVVRDLDSCGRTCHSCQKACPYNIDATSFNGAIRSVDCTLCGECIAACPTNSLSISVGNKTAPRWTRILPPVIAALLLAAAFVVGARYELPTIDESWGIENGMKIETVRMSGLKTVKCYGSSMAFKARMEKVPGVHGVKTFVGSHTVVIKYDPAVTDADKVQESVFTPSHFRIWSPDPTKLSELKVLTIRTEKMYDKMDLNYLGLQFRQTGRGIFGLESEYACPLVIRVYVSPEEEFTSDWFKEIVSMKTLSMPVHGGGTKDTPVDFKYVKLEDEVSTISVKDFLYKMFDPFTAEFSGKYAQGDSTVVRKRAEVYEGKRQYIYEIADQSYEKPIIKRALPYLSNHLSKEEGVIGVYLTLNRELVPCIQVRFAAPMTADKVWKMMTMPKWTITYKADDVREEDARMKFENPGTVFRYENE